MLTTIPTHWWKPETFQQRRPQLVKRNSIRYAIWRWFRTQDFMEVETAGLQISPGLETHLHAFGTEAILPDGAVRPLFLRTSPEFAHKKLLAAGEQRIFEFARVWRNRERGPLHQPEFTLLEWYRTEAAYEAMMDDCASLIGVASDTVEVNTFRFRDRVCDPYQEPERLTLAEAFDRYAGLDLLATVSPDGSTNLDEFRAAARDKGIRIADDDTWADVFSRVLVEKIEPNLGLGRPTILHEYPTPEASLARPTPADARVAERFEVYCCGVELANGFSELTDPAEQRRRFQAELAEKERIYGEAYPIVEEFLEALEIMPPAAGCALGFDRLVMLACAVDRILDVTWTPVAR